MTTDINISPIYINFYIVTLRSLLCTLEYKVFERWFCIKYIVAIYTTPTKFLTLVASYVIKLGSKSLQRECETHFVFEASHHSY